MLIGAAFGVAGAGVGLGLAKVAKVLGRVVGGEAAAGGEAVKQWLSKIANGHAWTKHSDHWKSLRIKNPQQLASRLTQVVEKGEHKVLSDGREAWWANSRGTKGQGIEVIKNPIDPNEGTAFIPNLGKKYFNQVLK